MLRLEAPSRNSCQRLSNTFEANCNPVAALSSFCAVPRNSPSFDAWGDAGDSVPLMRAVKHQLDPKNTLNPGRFVGGI